ncbi:MAG: M15 family metallopeptidase [Lachnospiraceae bacterium]|nr:M15 family metallopeptidase [Lachnospiraceae bacterium]
MRQAAKPFLFLLTLILVCAFLAHYLIGQETLLDYARENPELAYGSKAPSAETQTQPSQPDPGQNTLESGLTESDNSSLSQTTQSSTDQKNSEVSGASADSTPVTPDKSPAYPENESKETEASEPMPISSERVTYEDGFYYEPLTDLVKERITGISYPESGCTVPYEDLAYVGLLYFDFEGKEQTGELICNKAIAQDMVEIFYELYRNEYQLERVRLIDEYGGDDTASMADNNTSCFNYRVVDGTTSLSKHAYGLAIDVNPYYNPYVVFNKNGDGDTYISPPGSEVYADRSQNFAYKIDENDLCYRLFTEHGFTWGGNWNSTKDYQHFQKVIH